MNDRTDRNLLLAFVLGVLLCAAAGAADLFFLLFTTVVPFFCLQLLLLRRTKHLAARLIPVYPIALMLAIAGYYWVFGSGWDRLVTLLFGCASIAPAVGILLAWGGHTLYVRMSKNKEAADEG